MKLTFRIDYEFCPKGHKWVFLSGCQHSDCWWCEECNCFYEPSVRKLKLGVINKNYYCDREAELIQTAKFKQWKEKLTIKDMENNL